MIDDNVKKLQPAWFKDKKIGNLKIAMYLRVTNIYRTTHAYTALKFINTAKYLPSVCVNTPFCDTRKSPTFSKMHQHWHGVSNSLDCQGTPERSFMHQTGLLESS